jgi:hypothetical protein
MPATNFGLRALLASFLSSRRISDSLGLAARHFASCVSSLLGREIQYGMLIFEAAVESSCQFRLSVGRTRALIHVQYKYIHLISWIPELDK